MMILTSNLQETKACYTDLILDNVGLYLHANNIKSASRIDF